MKEMTMQQTEQRIKELHQQKVELLNKYGIFGGGLYVNAQFEKINKELESLGVDPNS